MLVAERRQDRLAQVPSGDEQVGVERAAKSCGGWRVVGGGAVGRGGGAGWRGVVGWSEVASVARHPPTPLVPLSLHGGRKHVWWFCRTSR